MDPPHNAQEESVDELPETAVEQLTSLLLRQSMLEKRSKGFWREPRDRAFPSSEFSEELC